MSSPLSSSDLGKTQHELDEKFNQFKTQVAAAQKEYETALLELKKQGFNIDPEQIPSFTRHFWHVSPTKNPNEWEVAVPVIFPFNIGYFDRTDPGYNVFIINKYTQWFGEPIPDYIGHEINIPKPLDITIVGSEITFPEDKQELIEQKFGKHLSLIEKNKATVKQGQEFDLIAEIINSGSLPFVPQQVHPNDLMDSDFTQIWDPIDEKYNALKMFEGKYSYQGDAWRIFEKYGSVGIFWLMSFGKTVIGTYIFSRVKGPKLLVVPSITLKEQWEEFFKRNCPRLLQEVSIQTYQGLTRKGTTIQTNKGSIDLKNCKGLSTDVCRKEYAVVVFDECHYLPADTFSKLATLKTKYRVGLSATPYREDNRTNLIMALTGYPIGIDPRAIMQVLGKEYHTVNVHIVKDLASKYALAKQLYNSERRTLFFVYRLDVGSKLAEMFNIPFISGESKARLDLVDKNHSFVASKTLEQGLSIKDLEHIIEVDFQFGGRQEQTQRTGRLMHSEAKDKIHDILMTQDELERYGKRLHGLFEKGFRPRLITHLGKVTGLEAESIVKTVKAPKLIKNWRKLIDELYDEGFFQAQRLSNAIYVELERRGVKRSDLGSHLNDKLGIMVKDKKLYRVPTSGGVAYISRKT